MFFFFFFQAEDGIRDATVTGVQTCALPIWPLPELPPSNAAKARQALVVRTARERNMTLREIARHTAAGTGHRVLVGTADYMADELETWLKQDAADGFNVICNYYPQPFEDFT